MENTKRSLETVEEERSLIAAEQGSLSAAEQGSLSAAKQGSLSAVGKGSLSAEQNETPHGKKKTWNLKKEVLFLTMFASNVIAYMTYSLMAPLFPMQAEAKGVTYTVQGLIFGCYALTQVISSPLIGKLMPYIGFRCTFITGILFVSVWNILFGFLPWLEDRTLFIICCFACRIGMALGITAVNNAMFVVVCLTWPHDIAFRLGTIESALGIGSMVGPVCAGLADLGGYYLPFLVMGLLPVLPAAMATLTMPAGSSDPGEGVSILTLFKIPGVFIMSLAMFLCFGTPVMLEPLLAPHLEPFDLSLSLVGLVFLIQPLVYTIFTPILGKIVGRVKHKLPVMVYGAYGMALSFLFLGPSPLIGLQQYQQLWPTLICLGTLGCFWALAMVPTFERFIAYATYVYPDIEVETLMSSLGSLIWMMVSAGDFIGPVLAGSLYDACGFSWTMTVAALLCVFVGTMLLVVFIMFGNNAVSCGRSKKDTKMSTEKEALLGDNNEKIISEDDCRKPTKAEDSWHVLHAYLHPREFIFRVMDRYNPVTKSSELQSPCAAK